MKLENFIERFCFEDCTEYDRLVHTYKGYLPDGFTLADLPDEFERVGGGT